MVGAMLPRERVFAAIEFAGPDRPALIQSAHAGPLCEHGENLLALWKRYPQDFGDLSGTRIPQAPENAFRPDYYHTETDIWSVTWEFRLFGIAGHPKERPLDDLSALQSYKPPTPPVAAGPEFDKARERATKHKETYYLLAGWINLFEVMHAVRRFEDVLMDLADDAPHIHRIADLIVGYQAGCVEYLLAYGADGIMFADDWGTALGPIVSLDVWRRFFRPRYEKLMAPVRAAGRHIFYHCCGNSEWLLDELADLGVKVVWPQLTANDNLRLAEWCRRRRVALMAHPDRGALMPKGTPAQVRAEVQRLYRLFGPEGGLIFQGEVDLGYPSANITALYDEIFNLRGGCNG